MEDNLMFGPVQWSRFGECLFLEITGTGAYVQVGPFGQNHPVHSSEYFADGKTPTLRQITHVFPELKDLTWQPTLQGSFPSIEVHGEARGLEVRLLDVVGKTTDTTQEEKTARKGESLCRLSEVLSVSFKTACLDTEMD